MCPKLEKQSRARAFLLTSKGDDDGTECRKDTTFEYLYSVSSTECMYSVQQLLI